MSVMMPKPSEAILGRRQSIVDAKSTIRELSPEQREAWVSVMKPVWQQFEGDIGADVIETAASYSATN